MLAQEIGRRALDAQAGARLKGVRLFIDAKNFVFHLLIGAIDKRSAGRCGTGLLLLLHEQIGTRRLVEKVASAHGKRGEERARTLAQNDMQAVLCTRHAHIQEIALLFTLLGKRYKRGSAPHKRGIGKLVLHVERLRRGKKFFGEDDLVLLALAAEAHVRPRKNDDWIFKSLGCVHRQDFDGVLAAALRKAEIVPRSLQSGKEAVHIRLLTLCDQTAHARKSCTPALFCGNLCF